MKRTVTLLTITLASALVGQDAAVLDDDAWLAAILDLEGNDVDALLAGELAYPEIDTEDKAFLEDYAKQSFYGIPWMFDGRVAMGLGWRENVLLTEDTPLSSAYGQVEFDAFAMKRNLGEGPELIGVLYGEYRYFESVPGMDSESLVIGNVNADWNAFGNWKLGLLGEAMFSEQAFDASLEEFETEATTIGVFQPELGVSFTTPETSNRVATLLLKTGKVFYDEEGQDYRLSTVRLEADQRIGGLGTLQGVFSVYQEDYDDKLERNLEDGLLEDSLAVVGMQVSAGWEKRFDQGLFRDLRTNFRYESEDDAVGDYYERETLRVKQSFGLVFGDWKGRVSASYFDRRYQVRPISFTSDENRRDEGWSWSLQLERPVLPQFDLLIRIDGADKSSNADGYSYETSGAFLGLSWKGKADS